MKRNPDRNPRDSSVWGARLASRDEQGDEQGTTQ